MAAAQVMYEDFVQKRNWARLVKLAKDKSNLPIASAMDAIVASVRAYALQLLGLLQTAATPSARHLPV